MKIIKFFFISLCLLLLSACGRPTKTSPVAQNPMTGSSEVCKTSEFSVKGDPQNIDYEKNTGIKIGDDFVELIEQKREIEPGFENQKVRCFSESSNFKVDPSKNDKILFTSLSIESNALCNEFLDKTSQTNKDKDNGIIKFVKTECRWNGPKRLVFMEKKGDDTAKEKTTIALPQNICKEFKDGTLKTFCYLVYKDIHTNSTDLYLYNKFGSYFDDSFPFGESKYLFEVNSKRENDILEFKNYIIGSYFTMSNGGVRRNPEMSFYKHGELFNFSIVLDSSRGDIYSFLKFAIMLPDEVKNGLIIQATIPAEKSYLLSGLGGSTYQIKSTNDFEELNNFLNKTIGYSVWRTPGEYTDNVLYKADFDIWNSPKKYYDSFQDQASFNLYLNPSDVALVEDFINKNWGK